MFICNFVQLTKNDIKRLQNKICGLTALSAACASLGIHPAQGIRLVRRKLSTRRTSLYQKPNAMIAQQLISDACTTLLSTTHKTIQSSTKQHPDHFLIHTILPQPLNSIVGYISPILNVQPDIHFIRTQRHYNKRRYARVRVASRPSFWTGMLLSTIMTGAFWGSTVQSIDWQTVIPLSPDPSTLILMGYLLLIYRAWTLMLCVGTPYYRELNTSRRGWLSILLKL